MHLSQSEGMTSYLSWEKSYVVFVAYVLRFCSMSPSMPDIHVGDLNIRFNTLPSGEWIYCLLEKNILSSGEWIYIYIYFFFLRRRRRCCLVVFKSQLLSNLWCFLLTIFILFKNSYLRLCCSWCLHKFVIANCNFIH